MSDKGKKTRKQPMGILEKMAQLSEGRRDQVRCYVEQAVSEEQLIAETQQPQTGEERSRMAKPHLSDIKTYNNGLNIPIR